MFWRPFAAERDIFLSLFLVVCAFPFVLFCCVRTQDHSSLSVHRPFPALAGERLFLCQRPASPISANVQLVWAPWDNLASESNFFLSVLIFALAACCRRQNFQQLFKPEVQSEFIGIASVRVKYAVEPRVCDAERFDMSFSVSFQNKLRPRYVAPAHSLILYSFSYLILIWIFATAAVTPKVIGLAKIDGDARRLNVQPACSGIIVGFGQGTSP